VGEYQWSALRERAIRLYGDVPRAETEARVISVFESKPALVAALVDEVGNSYARGNVRSAWALLAHRLDEAVAAEERSSSIYATDETERDAKVARAEKWVRSAGVHYDRADEVVDELFGDHGMLRAWAYDDELQERLIGLWRAQRPRGEKTEREAEERQRRQGEQYRLMRASQRRKPVPDAEEG